MDGPEGPQVAILAPGAKGLTAVAAFAPPAVATSLAWGSLGSGQDLAVGSGDSVMLIYGALGQHPQTETVGLGFTVAALAVGDFIWDRDARQEIAVLGSDGAVRILQHGQLDTRPISAADVPGRRAAMLRRPSGTPNALALGPWTIAKQLPYTGSPVTGPVARTAFSSPRLAPSRTHDLMVLDASKSQLSILDTSGETANASATMSFSGTPVAAVALPQKINAARDVVVLTTGAIPLVVAEDAPDPTYNVNTTADIDTVDACAQNSTVTSSTGTLSLREAVCEANNSGAATSVINLPAGTYDLAISTFGGSGSAYSSGELQVGIQSGNNITISGAGQGNTIIQQTNGHDRIIEQDELFVGNTPVTVENLTLQLGVCSDANGLDCADNGGGAILGGGPGDNVTITDVTMADNESNPSTTEYNDENGGALSYVGGTLTITGSTFTGNKASAFGGAIWAMVGYSGGNIPSDFIITNSTFTDNTALSGDPTSSNGQGGAIGFSLAGDYPASITGSTFTGNKVLANNVNEPGGAISAQGASTDTFTMSNSRIVGNTAPGGGTGAYLVFVNPVLNNNWWGCNGGPNTSGCDSILQDVSGSNVSYNPSTWLVLSVSASPTQIETSGTSTLTADLTHNSGGTGGFSVPDGTPVTFGGTLDSSVNPTSTTFTSGDATSTYTAGSSAGDGTGTATVDNQEVSTPVVILVGVTVTTSPGNLSITVDGTTYTAPHAFGWVAGSQHTLNTTSPQTGPPGSQYVWSSWSQGGTQSQMVTAPSAAATYTANFDTQYQLTMVASPSADGTVTPTSGQYFASGASVPVTATANAGFAFNNWTSSGGGFGSTTSASTTFTMPSAAATVTGNFVSATAQITITTYPANLLVSVDGSSFVPAPLVETWDQNSTHTIATTSPQSGGTGIQYAFSSWSDSGAISHTITVPSTATAYTATFNTQYQLTMVSSPSADGSVTPTSGQYFASGASVPVTATANAGFAFNNWTSSGGGFGSTTSASTNFTMPSAAATVTGNFVSATTQITITTYPANLLVSVDGGSFVPAPLVETWDQNSTHTIATTSPQSGGTGVQYAFSSWSDSGAISHTITVPSTPTTYTASFATQYFLTVSAGTGGTLAGTTAPNAFYNAGTVQTIAATPNAGYYFVDWTGNVPSDITGSTSATAAVTMNAPEFITANFAPIPGYIVSTTADDATGVAANCPASPSIGSACSLRDALAAAASEGGNITFDATAFGTAQTITLANGALSIPSATTITGATTGSGATLVNLVTVDGNGASGVFTVGPGVTGASIANLTIQHGNNAGLGGGIANNGTFTLTGSTVSGNTAGAGGGIYNNGTLTLTGSTVSGNTSDGAGGGIYINGTSTTMSDDTVTGNLSESSGGGIYNNAILVVSDSTLSANAAATAFSGGGIDNSGSGTVALANSVLSGNTSNSVSDDFAGGAYTDSGGNIIGVANGGTVNGTAINLAPLANYGGPTQTLIPLPGSPAICAGSSGLIPAGITTDQRGYLNSNTSYGFTPSPCVDAGAVQTNYALNFTTQPADAPVATDFAAAVTLTESGNPFQPVVTIPLTLTGTGTLTGGSAATSAGVASYTLQVDTAGAGDTLTANLALIPAVAISATSNAFGVGLTTPTVSLDYSTSGSIAYGTPETFSAYLPSAATGTVIFYNNGSTFLGSGTVGGGTATFSSSTLAAGSYSITAYYSGDSNYNPNTSSPLSLTVYPVPATITSPTSPSTLTSAATTFSWNTVSGSVTYGLNVGTTGIGSADLVNIGPLSGTSVTVNLPTNGTPIYVRLWTIYNGTGYLYNDYTYTEFTQSPAVITIPTNGSTLTTAATTFTWSPGPVGTTGYGLNIGTTGVGSADLVNIGPLSGTSVTVNLPTNGTPIYVRLWTILNGTTYLSNDYTYTEFTQSPAVITIPTNTSTLTSASTTFTWSPGPAGTTGYGLNIGTTGVGSADLVNIGPLSGPSVTVNLPTNGTLIYVRLWTILNGTTYLSNDYTYTEFTQSPAVITIPTNTSTLTSASTTFTWSAGPDGTTGYGLNIGTTGVGSADLVNIGPLSGPSVTVNLPTNGTPIYVRLWTILNGTTYLSNDYTYTEFTQ